MSYDVTIEERPAQPAAVVCGRVKAEDLPAFLGDAFAEVMKVLGEQHLAVIGPPFGFYQLVEDGFDVKAGFPCAGPVDPTGRVEGLVLPGGTVALTTHVGPYDGVSAAYEALTAWLHESDYVPTYAPWESYLDEPSVTQPRTVVCFPCRKMHPEP